MSLTLEQSQEVYKEEVTKSKTTESPIKNIPTKEKINTLRKEFGNSVANKAISDEIKKKVLETKNILLPNDILNKTEHLPNYDLVRSVMSLQGEEYTLIAKDIHKLLISLAIPQKLRIIKVGDIKTDLRVNPKAILSSGKGKKNIGETVKRIYLLFKPEANIKEPRTIHYQHLIGKMLLREEKIDDGETSRGTPKFKTIKKWIPKYGYLNSDLLILEESYELFNSQEKNDVDCRDAILVALDTYGENLIQKQNMDNLDNKEETLAYYPYVTILSFMQPLMLNETYVTKGVSRRFSINYRDFPERTKLDKYVNRLVSKSDHDDCCIKFASYMKKINNITTDWELSSDAIETFTLCHAALLEQGFRQGGKIAHYTRILEFPMQNILLKMSALQAISHLRTKITKEDVQLSFIDLLERLTYEFLYVEKKVKGTLDYGESWGGATGKTQQCLEELFEYGAINKETSIPIWQFQKVIARVFDISDRRAKDRYKEMKQDVLINDYLGQGKDNGVWISFEPKIKSEQETKEDELLDPKKLYLEFSGMTGMSAMTPKTGVQLIIKPEVSISIYNKDDKSQTTLTPKNDILENKNITKSSNTQNVSLSVTPDTADTAEEPKSDRDTQYFEAKECQNIKTCDRQEVLTYIQSNPDYTLSKLLEMFGSGVYALKKEGLLK